MIALITTALVLSLSAPPAPTASRKYASELSFYGWSPNSRYVAYTRLRRRPPRKRGVKPTTRRQYMHRLIKRGKLAGFGRMVGGNVRKYARDKDYILEVLEGHSMGDHRIQFDGLEEPLTLEVTVDDKIWWELRQGERLITRRPFTKLYVGAEVLVYPSPDRRQAIVVMHLDTGWVVDAAVYAVRLLPFPAKERALPETSRTRRQPIMLRAAEASNPSAFSRPLRLVERITLR